MARAKGIIAYGTDEDRRRLEALAQLAKTSASQWLIQIIRKEYEKVYPNAER